MIAWLDTLCKHLTDWQPTRRLLELFLRQSIPGGKSTAARETLALQQARVLRGLVHVAQHSRFGKDHDFGRIRTVADFRRVTPVITPADLLRRYWEPAFPWLAGTTWPNVLRILENPAPGLPYVPMTPAFLQRAAGAWLAGLGQVLAAFPRCSLLRGRILGLVESTGEPFTSVAWSRLPWTLRPYLHTRHVQQIGPDDYRQSTTCLLGSAAQIQALLAHVREQTGRSRLSQIWSDLRGILVLRSPHEPSSAELRAGVGRNLVVLDVVMSHDGIFAVEDFRQEEVRFVPDAGVFYELLPAAERCHDSPTRLGLAEAEPGVPYELVTTTPGGLWACRTGVGICLDRRDSLAVRFVPLPPQHIAAPAPPTEAIPLPAPLKPSRPRTLPGLPVPNPGLYRSPWSAGA